MAVNQEFFKQENKDMILIEEIPDKLLTRMESHEVNLVPKWIKKDERSTI